MKKQFHSWTLSFIPSLCKRKEAWLLLSALLLFSYSHAQVKVLVSPAASEVAVGDVFTVDVNVESGAQQIDGANIFLTFDPAVVTVVTATAGSALSTSISPLSFNNTTGAVTYAYGTFSDYPSGNFNLFSLQFRAISSGNSALSFVSRNSIPSDLSFRGASVLEVKENGQVTVSGTSTKTDQTISFTEITAKTLGDPAFALDASASSGLPVSFSVISGPATLDDNIVTLTGTGTVTIEATQAGNDTYNAAPAVRQNFLVSAPAPLAQTINFPALTDKTFGDGPVTLEATASSGLEVSFEVVSGPAILSDNMLTLTGAGDVTIKATQAGNDTYAPATPIEHSFTVNKASQTIDFAALTDKVFGDAPFALLANASSGLEVSFEVVSGPATLADNTLTLTGSGEVTVKAIQAGNENFLAATPVSHTFEVQPPVIATCPGTGGLLWQQWTGLSGNTTLSAIPVNTAPNKATVVSSFATPANIGDNYGSLLRGYICAPMSGQYTFFIAGDDHTELWLSSSEDPANKTKIAFSNAWTNLKQYDRYPSQQSALVTLEAGKRYYVEAIHREYAGGDHISVAWRMPDGTFQETIPGNNLIPFVPQVTEAPQVALTSPASGSAIFTAGTAAVLVANVTDPWAREVTVEFFNGETKLGQASSAPYIFNWQNLQVGSYPVTAKVTDKNGLFSYSAPVSITVQAPVAVSCEGTGGLLWQQWTGLSGNTTLSAIPVNTAPNKATVVSSFATPANIGDNYGSLLRGYICAPMSGQYTFFIAGDDHTELWLSSSEDPANKTKIAFSNAWTNLKQYDRYSSQQSALVTLEAGKRYYVEAIHREYAGGDHISVAWRMPDGTFQETIPGNNLIPFVPQVTEAPQVALTSPASGSAIFTAGTAAVLVANVTDPWAREVTVEFFNGETKLGQASSAPYIFNWQNLQVGSYPVTAKVTDKNGLFSYSAPVSITVQAPVAVSCEGTGGLLWQQWTGLSGNTTLSAIPVNTAPNKATVVSSFATPANIGDNYGSLLRGYICAPMSGQYTFFIAGDDHTELWLSTSEDPANKTKIAFSNAWTNLKQYDRYPSQQSALVTLEAGKRYYVEAIHREYEGHDHISVAWRMPDGTFQETIPGNNLIPFTPQVTIAAQVQRASGVDVHDVNTMELYPNPSPGNVSISFMAEEDEAAVLQVFDLKGALVKTVFQKRVMAGQTYSFEFDGSANNSGVYICRLTLGKQVINKRLVIMH